ncbi:MAG: Mfa1 fimbrilin C-terminal domain-containing protein, partial [Duncaniella sp.]|nr:Mfa1 fimbrilin C-terminal domain-containing protein [Duncaniella sp.]
YLLPGPTPPTGAQPKSTLDATAKTLEVAATWSEGTGDSKKTHFVMCTTSYYGKSETHDNDTYFANVIDPKYFYSEPVPDNLEGKNVLNVYVERLAVKVQVAIDNNLGGSDDKKVINGETYYKLPLTVGGNENGPVSDITAATEIWVKFIGWGLNSTAKQTYLAKQLPAVTSETATQWNPFDNWNDASNFRSYWGQGVAYDKDIEAVVDNTYINFVSAPTLTGNVALASELAPANAAYCNEYTNTPDKIFKEVNELVNGVSTPVNRVIPAKTTSVALKAVAYEKDNNDNFTPLNLVMHNGILFKQPNYRAYLLNTIDQAKKLNFYTYVGTVEIPVEGYTPTTEDKFTQIDETYFVLASAGLGTGTVKVVPNLPEGTKLYEQKADGKFYPIADPATALKTVLDEAQNVETWGKSIAYTDGLMAYTIPVEHLNADKTNLGEGETNPNDQKREGYYGVVRNHWYKVTVTKLTRIGRGIFVPGDGSQENPGEPIIPDEPDDPTYYLGAQVSILSWKIVNQSAGI